MMTVVYPSDTLGEEGARDSETGRPRPRPEATPNETQGTRGSKRPSQRVRNRGRRSTELSAGKEKRNDGGLGEAPLDPELWFLGASCARWGRPRAETAPLRGVCPARLHPGRRAVPAGAVGGLRSKARSGSLRSAGFQAFAGRAGGKRRRGEAVSGYFLLCYFTPLVRERGDWERDGDREEVVRVDGQREGCGGE